MPPPPSFLTALRASSHPTLCARRRAIFFPRKKLLFSVKKRRKKIIMRKMDGQTWNGPRINNTTTIIIICTTTSGTYKRHTNDATHVSSHPTLTPNLLPLSESASLSLASADCTPGNSAAPMVFLVNSSTCFLAS